MTAPFREIELKFLLTPATREAMAGASACGGEVVVKRMTAIYFDTADDGLRRCGFGLRVRVSGDERIQTLKSAMGDDGGRDEWEWPVSTADPDLRLLSATPAALPPGATLEPKFKVFTLRTITYVVHEGARIECAVDDGYVEAGDQSEGFVELELELVSGPRSGLDDYATTLRERFSLTPSTVTKAERGFRLLGKT